MPKKKRTPNGNNEFLLDVLPYKDTGTDWCIYDISIFLPHWNGYDRTRYFNRISHSIKGNQFVIHIIDYHNSLTEKQAKLLASEWYLGNTINYRLD